MTVSILTTLPPLVPPTSLWHCVYICVSLDLQEKYVPLHSICPLCTWSKVKCCWSSFCFSNTFKKDEQYFWNKAGPDPSLRPCTVWMISVQVLVCFCVRAGSMFFWLKCECDLKCPSFTFFLHLLFFLCIFPPCLLKLHRFIIFVSSVIFIIAYFCQIHLSFFSTLCTDK